MRKILCTFPFLFFLTFLSAQNTPSPVNIDYTPPSPNASSLGKFGDIPVSNYTGIPEVKIPIYTIKSKYLSLPISLHYHAGGVRVEETASSVGLSWSLNAGGVISRTVMGLNDERLYKGFIRIGPIPPMQPSTLSTYIDFQKGILDGQADLFNFNFASYVGKFVINKSHEVVKAPWSRMKLEFELGVEEGVDHIVKWKATGEDGTQYFFENREYTTVLETINLLGENPPITETPTPHVSSWYLTKIISANGLEEYTFQYEPYTMEYYQNVVETHYSLGTKANSKIKSKVRVQGQRLTGIIFPYGEIMFQYSSADRCDLIGDKALQKIIIIDGEFEKEYSLEHKYFAQGAAVPFFTCNGGESNLGLRLRLDGLTEDPLADPKHYRIEYFEDSWLPDRFSSAQDHWGYYNGKLSNTTLVPAEYFSQNIGGTLHQSLLPGADRNPDAHHVKAGSIKRLYYPTGGHTEFDLEINDCQSAELPHNVQHKSASVSGSSPTQQSIYIHKIARPFVVLNVSAMVPGFADPNCYLILRVSGNGFNKILKQYYSTSLPAAESFVVNVPTSGHYAVSVEVSSGSCAIEDPFSFNITWENEVQTESKIASGLRARKVTDYPVIGLKKSKFFIYRLVSGQSSGGVLTTPKYGYFTEDHDPYTLYYARTQFTNNPLVLTQGGAVGYSRVVMSDDSLNANGYTELTYTSPLLYPDDYSNTLYPQLSCLEFPFAPSQSREWMRGLLLSTKNYRRDGTTYTQIDGENNEYQFNEVAFLDDPVLSVKTGIYSYSISNGVILDLRVHNYEFRTNRQTLKRTIRQTLSEGSVLIDTIEYEYTGNFFISKAKRIADEKISETRYFYPDFYVGNSQMDSLVDLNILNVPVSSENWVMTNGGSYLTAAQSTEYDQPTQDVFLPKVSWFFKGKIAQAELPPLSFSDIVRDRARFEKTAQILSRDIAGNVIELLDQDSLPVVYVWDSYRRNAIAKVINAKAQEVYHTSFEEKLVGQNTNETYKTGQQARALMGSSFPITSFVSPVHGKNYLLTYWWKPTLQSTWELQVENYNTYQSGQPVQTSKTSGFIDEVRFHPADAQMSTFTYKSGTGVLSITDANHVSAHFDYDATGRLLSVRDEQGNILTNYQYHYVNPVTNN